MGNRGINLLYSKWKTLITKLLKYPWEGAYEM